MMGHFKLTEKETIVFTIDNDSVMYARIYQKDGKEIDYERRADGISSNAVESCLWDVDCDFDTGKKNFYELLYTFFFRGLPVIKILVKW